MEVLLLRNLFAKRNRTQDSHSVWYYPVSWLIHNHLILYCVVQIWSLLLFPRWRYKTNWIYRFFSLQYQANSLKSIVSTEAVTSRTTTAKTLEAATIADATTKTVTTTLSSEITVATTTTMQQQQQQKQQQYYYHRKQ